MEIPPTPMTQIVAIIYGPTIANAKEQIEKAATQGADLAEIRLDHFEPEALEEISKLPCSLPLNWKRRKGLSSLLVV